MEEGLARASLSLLPTQKVPPKLPARPPPPTKPFPSGPFPLSDDKFLNGGDGGHPRPPEHLTPSPQGCREQPRGLCAPQLQGCHSHRTHCDRCPQSCAVRSLHNRMGPLHKPFFLARVQNLSWVPQVWLQFKADPRLHVSPGGENLAALGVSSRRL